jgi:hypothetical protein
VLVKVAAVVEEPPMVFTFALPLVIIVKFAGSVPSTGSTTVVVLAFIR